MITMMVQKGLYYDPTGIRYTLPSIAETDRRNTGGKYSIISVFSKRILRWLSLTKDSRLCSAAVSMATCIPHGTQARDFVWLVQHGMTPAAALQSATVVMLGNDRGGKTQVGSITKGKYADMIAVSGDPLEDISEMQRVKFVMKAGKVVRNDLTPGAMISSR